MIGLILATRMEAEPLLALLAAQELSAAPYPLFSFAPAAARPGGVIIICGMGKEAAGAAAEQLIAGHGAGLVVNLGICGALAENMTVGQVYRVVQALDGDAAPCVPLAAVGLPVQNTPSTGSPTAASATHLPEARLVSVAEPVFTVERRRQLLAHAEIVDMEGFAVAQVCARRGVPCLMLKGVSDLANHTGQADIRRNIQAVSAQLAQVAVAGLERLAVPSPLVGEGRRERSERGVRGGIASVPLAAVGLPVRNTPSTGSPTAASGTTRLLRFIKFEHSAFSLPLLFAGAWVGAGMRSPSWRVLGLIALAGVGARTLGMAANRIFDRRLDALNPRTAGRELPSGGITLVQARAVALAGLALYLLACAGLGKLCLLLSPLPALPLLGYSLLKRFTSLCHFGIGLCQAIGPPAAFVAASGTVAYDGRVALLALFTFLWMSGFDIIYALQDLAADRRAGVHSLPASLGAGGAQAAAALLHAGAAAAIVWLWRMTGGGLCGGSALAISLAALIAGNMPWIPLAARFFPLSALASIAGAMIPLLGGLP